MKYLSKYENHKQYNVEDYILIRIFNYKNDEIIKGKILKITPAAHFPYKVKFDDNTIDTIYKDNIIRHLTSDEIDEYEARIQAKKYNL